MVNIHISIYSAVFILVQYFISGKCKIESDIVGGHFADIKEFPYVAYLQIYPYKNKTGFTCGSSILNSRLLLTAAHCLTACKQHCEIVVSAGDVTSMKGVISTGKSLAIHEGYIEQIFENDIALTSLDTPFEYSDSINRVSLKPSYKMRYTEDAVVAGWGLTGAGVPSKKLKYVIQYVLSNQICLVLLHNINENEFCAEGEEGYPSRGDSGSALVIQDNIQIGIVSYNILDFHQEFMVYTDVTKYFRWISKMWPKIKALYRL